MSDSGNEESCASADVILLAVYTLPRQPPAVSRALAAVLTARHAIEQSPC